MMRWQVRRLIQRAPLSTPVSFWDH
jgi:hypothetical protein